MRTTLDQTIALQEAEAPRERRLVDGERILELFQICPAHAREGREDAELSHPETARPQDVVVELRHRASGHPQRVADTGVKAVQGPVVDSWTSCSQPGSCQASR